MSPAVRTLLEAWLAGWPVTHGFRVWCGLDILEDASCFFAVYRLLVCMHVYMFGQPNHHDIDIAVESVAIYMVEE